jgi:hypothetical protein
VKWWPASMFRCGGLVDPTGPRTVRSAARELGRLGGQVIGARRHMEAEAKRHAEHERMKAVTRSMRANAKPPMRPLPILEPSEFNEGA